MEDKNIYQRDPKPENIMIDKIGNVYQIDLGGCFSTIEKGHTY